MTFRARLFVLFIASLCWAGLSLSAQPAQLDFRQYNTDDGLPSSEVYIILEDQSGYLWFGTDNGVARFDGYEFQVFDADDGLEDMVVFGILEDAAGRIWISTYTGKIYIYDGDKFSLYQHSNVLEDIKRSIRLGVLIDVTAAGEPVIRFQNDGILKINTAGEVEWLTNLRQKQLFLYQSEMNWVKNKSACPHGFFHTRHPRGEKPTDVLLMTDDEHRLVAQIPSERMYPSRSFFSGIFHGASGWEYIINTRKQTLILDQKGKLKHDYRVSQNLPNYFMPGTEDSTYWAFLERGGGLQFHDLRSGKKTPEVTQHLFGRSLTSGIFDSSGGFWVASLDAGVFYCPYPEQQLFQKEDVTQNGKSISIVVPESGYFYAGYEDGTIFHYGKGMESLRQVQDNKMVKRERLFDLYYDATTSKVFTPDFSFAHPAPKDRALTPNDVQIYWETNLDRRSNFNHFNQISREDPRKIYASHISHVDYLNLDNNQVEQLNPDHRTIPGNGHVFAMHHDGTPLAGTLSGLMELDAQGNISPNNLSVPELSNRVVFIKILGEEELLFGTRGDGLVFVGPDTTYLIQEKDGLASDMIRDIHLSEQGVVWVSTLAGLSRIDFREDLRAYKLRTFRMEHGLPSIEIYQTDTYKDEIWLASSAGVVRFVEPPVAKDSPRPNVRRVVLNGEVLPDTTVYNFKPGKPDVSISFGTINYVLRDEILYRYRLQPDAPWQLSRERTVNFPNLGAGAYRFEVQSRNQDGVWSESTVRELSVATPWYATIWGIAGGVLLLLGLLSGYFLLRERRRKREQDLLFQITQLEHAALHAQMNPHFVFNALNSIQNFVLENDAKQAATYLARFARVIRQTLRSSVDGRHHLGEELKMLETYLSLEKLRFKRGFSYTVEVDPQLPKDSIVLPPLLIQPFVENAIIHGLKGKKRGGRISIQFTGSAELLKVIIEDNGRGYQPEEPSKADSLGMDITRRRLHMMNRTETEHSGMRIEPLYDENGSPRGTRVTLYIRPLTAPAPASAPPITST